MQYVPKKYTIAGALAIAALAAIAIVAILLIPAPSNSERAAFERWQAAHSPSRTQQKSRGVLQGGEMNQ